MNILILGSGGREHAFARILSRSMHADKIVCAPGNAGMAQHGTCRDVDPMDFDAVVALAREETADLVIIGPEAPLVGGLTDLLEAEGFKVFGPSKDAAKIEGSKTFLKEICAEAGIPTAASESFTDAEAAKDHLRQRAMPAVIKADGLAAGKGVVIAASLEEAEATIDEMFLGKFGAAGQRVVIEDYMEGEEASLFVISDGKTIMPLPTAQDHKRVGDGDTGPNTGGMGAYSPAPVMTPFLVETALNRIVRPALKALEARGTPFKGVLYAGLMVTAEGPKLIEFNCRFGDPEAQVILPRIVCDFLPILWDAACGNLKDRVCDWRPETALCVVMAAKGYPGSYERGSQIGGIDAAEKIGAIVYHAGTQHTADGRLIATGGRVLAVTALGETVTAAQERAYDAVSRIDWPGGFYRHDIGWRAVDRETGKKRG
jgi:phosphoribosylamine--glycine ligase